MATSNENKHVPISGQACGRSLRTLHLGIVHRVGASCAIALACLLLVACSSMGDASVIALNQKVLLVPPVNAGSAGWCMAIAPEGGCAQGRSRPPIVAETGESSGPPAVTMIFALTLSDVRSVSIGGSRPIPTHAEASLPSGLREVGVKIRGLNPEFEVVPRLMPMNAHGVRVHQAPGRGTEFDQGALSTEVPIRSVENAAHPTSGACRIVQGTLRDLTARVGSVITFVKSYSGLIGQGYISCASTSYDLDGWPLLACVLLDAAHPGSDPPALPAMKPLQGHPGVFEAPGPEGFRSEKALLARRIRGGWLVVARAKPQQRLTLLEHLDASVHV